jgi:hypothetical protein
VATRFARRTALAIVTDQIVATRFARRTALAIVTGVIPGGCELNLLAPYRRCARPTTTLDRRVT